MSQKITVSQQIIGDLTVTYLENGMVAILNSREGVNVPHDTLKIILDTVRQNAKAAGFIEAERENRNVGKKA